MCYQIYVKKICYEIYIEWILSKLTEYNKVLFVREYAKTFLTCSRYSFKIHCYTHQAKCKIMAKQIAFQIN